MISRYAGLTTALALALSLAATGAARAQTSAATNTDAGYVQNAMYDGTMETADAQTATERALSPDVRIYASALATDDGTADSKLAALAAQKSIAYDTTIPAPSEIAQTFAFVPATDGQLVTVPLPNQDDTYGVGGNGPSRDWQQQTGAAFDQAYMNYEVQQHLIDISLYNQEIANGTDPDLIAHARSMLPTLYGQLNAAQRFLGILVTPMPGS